MTLTIKIFLQWNWKQVRNQQENNDTIKDYNETNNFLISKLSTTNKVFPLVKAVLVLLKLSWMKVLKWYKIF